jgi:L-seryl-tRNA(Ser) seleniumtransferase
MAAQRSKETEGRQAATELLRLLPAVDRLLERADVAMWVREADHAREFVTRAVNAYLDEIRHGVLAGELGREELEARLADAAEGVRQTAARLAAPHLERVINATGVVVHTNLGRSPWPDGAAERVAELSRRYLNLEFDLATGGRGQRAEAIERLVGQVLPGTATAVVNNNAAAVLLILNTVAQGKEVIVSRGQLVEIGGSFRIPEVMEKSQSVLREVGTTNRTRLADYEAAIGSRTGALLSVHPSNYRVVGFTEEVDLAELAELGHRHGVAVVEDLGSGCLFDLSEIGINDEPSVAERLATGVDLISFSGDKLLGGPQAGFIVGAPEWVEKVRANPLYRALRLDKATTLALEATLAAYVTGNLEKVPAVRMLRTPVAELETRARDLAARISGSEVAGGCEVIEVSSRVGGGAAPGRDLPSFAVALAWGAGADDLMARLRAAAPPIIGRIIDDRVVLDVRTLLPEEDQLVAAAVEKLFAEKS